MRLDWDAVIRDTEFQATINRIETRVNNLSRNVQRQGRDMESVFANLAKVAGGFLSLNAAEGFVTKLIQVRSEFQQLEIAFTTMLGSKEKADKLTKDLIEFAGTTPFGMKDTANAAKQLLAYGSTAENVKNELRMLGDVAAGTSQPIGDLVYLYGTLRTQGRAYATDIRQFAGRGIPIYQELGKVLGVNKDQVSALVTAGKVGFAEVEKAFQNMTSAGSMFGGLMEAQSRTIQGELERLGDAFDLMLNNIGKNSEGVISTVIQGASAIIENYEVVLGIIGSLVVTYGAYRAALVVTAALHQLNAARVVGLTTVELLHYGAITAKTAAMRVLNAVMLANPVIAITGGIVLLTAAIYSLTQVTDATSAAQEKLNNVQEAGISKIDSERRSIEQLISVLKDNTASAEQKKAAYDKLQEQTKGILVSFNQEEIAAGKATQSINEYIKAIGRAASARKAFDEFNALAEKMDDLNRKGIDGVGVWNRAGRAIQNAFGANGTEGFKSFWKIGDEGKIGDKFLLDQEKEVLKKSMDTLEKEFGKEFKTFISGVEQTKESVPVDLFAQALKDPINNFNTLLKTVENKGQLDSLKKAVTEKLEALAPNDSKIASYKRKLEQLAAIEKQYSIGGKGNSSAGNSAYQQAERYNSLKLDIDKANESYLRSQLSRDQQEVESVRDKYRALREEIRKFNADPRNKTKIDGSSINATEANEIKETNTKIDTKYIIDNLNQQKALYGQFEAYKLQVGEEKAKERFQNELDLSKTFGQLAEKERYDLLETDPTAMTAAQKERLDALDKIIAEHDKNVKDGELAKYAEAYNTAKTHTQRLEDIEREYQQNIKALGNKASAEELANLKKLRDEKIKGENEEFFLKSDLYKKAAKEALIRTRQEIKDQIKAVEELLKTDLAPNIKDRLQKELQGLKINLSIGSVKTNIANLEKQRQDISNALSGYNTLNGISSITDQALDAHPELKKLYDQLNQVTDQIIKLKKETNDGSGGGFLGFLKKLEGNKALQEVSDWGNVAAQSFSEMSQALGGSETQAGYLLGTIGELAGAAADVAGAIASGDPKAIVKSVVGAVGSIISISRRTKEMNRQAREENKKFYDEAMKGERDYQALLRQRERESASRGKNSYNAIIAQLEAIKKQSPELQKAYDKVFSSLQGQDFIDGKGYQHGTWFRKAKTWDVMASLGGSDYNELEKLYSQGKLKDKAKEDFEALKALKEELEEAGLSVDDLQKSLKELLTGTSVSGLASGLADLFANGKRSAQDFGDSFESIMQNAIKSSFQAKFMEDAMQPFYEELAVMMEGGNLTGDQIQKLKDKYINLGEEYAKKWEDIEKVTGVDLSNKDKGSTGSLKNDIQAVTESTAGRLEAEFGGFRIAQLQTLAEVRSHGLTLSKQLEIANSNLVILNAIQVNTYRTAGNTDRLESIENALVSINNKVSSSDAARRGAGL
ncbi:tape measure protein [Sphingobacterium faecium]|uniref:tape measure protein n=1 Tax=Sphingobacterium faecium TaxID=34087 RepID=UPI0024786C86|nr:tape measure protein [Sphingobacterium faecium]WGQ15571.1 tape measure protein [Sphingobacterium faecium]